MIVSRGDTAASLKERNTLIPVVEIPVTSSDIAASIHKAFDQHGVMPVGVVGTINTIRGVRFMREQFPVPVKPFPTASINTRDLIDGMERAIADGCGLILAGHNTCHYCKEHGIPAGLLYSSVESVFLAITEAKRCANVSNIEKENSLIFRNVVDHVFEGIIAVDKDNNIRTFNRVFKDITGCTPSEFLLLADPNVYKRTYYNRRSGEKEYVKNDSLTLVKNHP